MSERRAAVIRRELIGFDWHRHRLSEVTETVSYDWAHNLADAVNAAITEAARDDAWAEEDNR